MSEWKKVKLGDIAEITMGQSPDSSSYNQEKNGIPFFQGNADFGDINPVVKYYCNLPKKTAEINDILLSVRAPIGAINIADIKCCIGRGLCSIRPKQEKCDFKFLYYTLIYKKDDLISKGTGSTFKAISKDTLIELQIPFFNLEKQKYISNTLDKANNLIALRKKQIEELDNLIQSIFYNMFGDPVSNKYIKKTLPEFVKDDKYSLKRGPFGGSLKKNDFVNDGYLVYEQRHAIHNDFVYKKYFITKEKYEEMKPFKVIPGDLIISCSGVTLGRIAEIPNFADEGIINQALLKLSLNNNKMNNTYFIQLFRNCRIQDILFGVSRGSGIPNFPSMDVIKSVKFLCPPIELQNKFAKQLLKIEQQKSLLQQSLEQMELNYKSLMLRAFNGTLFN